MEKVDLPKPMNPVAKIWDKVFVPKDMATYRIAAKAVFDGGIVTMGIHTFQTLNSEAPGLAVMFGLISAVCIAGDWNLRREQRLFDKLDEIRKQ